MAVESKNDNDAMYRMINEHYSDLARKTPHNSEISQEIARSFAYEDADLAAIPDGANLGVSCGNPVVLSNLRQGEIVVDLGCGAGFDIFQAARKVGEHGKAIGIDMSEEMLVRAKTNATKSGIHNVDFHLSRITSLPLPANSTDCVISNCVINLVPDSEKPLVFTEAYRILKDGGRLAVSDILEKKTMGQTMRDDLGLIVGCIAGASPVAMYEKWLRDAGFKDILILDKKSDLNIYKISEVFDVNSDTGERAKDAPAKSAGCCSGNGPTLEKADAQRIAETDFNEWVGSFDVYAIK